MKKLIERIKDNNDNIIFLYRWLADVKSTDEEYKYLCEYLYYNIDELEKHIPIITYVGKDSSKTKGWIQKKYRIATRDGYPTAPKPDEEYEKTGKHRQEEKYLAMDLFRMGRDGDNLIKINGLGYILDYEMPLGGNKNFLLTQWDDSCLFDKQKNGDGKYGILDPDKLMNEKPEDKLFVPGKCDLVAYENNIFKILELKVKNNPEPLLRAVMEAYTYLKLLDKKKATADFKEYYQKCSEINISDYENTTWTACPLLHINGEQRKEYERNDSLLRNLMDKLRIEPIWYDSNFSVIRL